MARHRDPAIADPSASVLGSVGAIVGAVLAGGSLWAGLALLILLLR
jgi:hypothetical protein